MKLECITIFVCFNSTSFSNNDFSSFKNSTKEERLLRNLYILSEIQMS